MSKISETLRAVVEETLAEREKTHGLFSEHAALSQALKDVMKGSRNWAMLSPEYKEGIDMIIHKLARIGSGNPYHKDHVHDIQGYAKLMEDADSCSNT